MSGSDSARIRVLVAENHPSVRENLRYLIDAEEDLECVGVAKEGRSAVRLSQDLLPDVVVLDEDLPGAPGLEILAWLVGALPSVGVVVYTLNTDVFEEARRLGAACVAKDASYEVLLRAIREAPSLASVR